MKGSTNIEVAILQRVNDLATRYGLKPTDFVATVRHSGPEGRVSLDYETYEPRHEEQFARMATALSLDPEDNRLVGSDEQIIDTLDRAIAVAPRSRTER